MFQAEKSDENPPSLFSHGMRNQYSLGGLLEHEQHLQPDQASNHQGIGHATELSANLYRKRSPKHPYLPEYSSCMHQL